MQNRRQRTFDDELVALLPRLQRFAMLLTRGLDARDELVQATVERMLSRYKQWNPGSRLDSWSFSIMHSIWKNDVRSQQMRRGGGQVDPEVCLSVSGERQVENKLILREIRDAVMRLPENQREPFLLVYIEGLSYQEAADFLEVPIGSIMSRLFRARRALGRSLAPASMITDKDELQASLSA